MADSESRVALIKKLSDNITAYPDFPDKGVIFRDVFSLLQNHELLKLLVETLVAEAKSLSDNTVNIVVGLDARGFLFGPLIALGVGAGFVPIRKKGKLPGATVKYEYNKEYGTDVFEIQEGSIKSGQRVLIMDDLIATGGSMLAACELVTKLGGIIIGCQLIIELKDLKGKDRVLANFKDIPFKILINF